MTERFFIETKVAAAEDGSISGIGWRFDQPDRVGDMIERGAFKGTRLPLPLLFGHDHNDPVGIWESADEAADGLRLKGRLLVEEVARAREVRALVASGAVRGLSIGFVTRKATTRPDGGRTIKSLELLEVSLVTLPMHPGARVTSAKSAVQALAIAEAINRAAARIAAR